MALFHLMNVYWERKHCSKHTVKHIPTSVKRIQAHSYFSVLDLLSLLSRNLPELCMDDALWFRSQLKQRQWRVMVTSMTLESNCLDLILELHHFLAMWPWKSYSASLCPSFLICDRCNNIYIIGFFVRFKCINISFKKKKKSWYTVNTICFKNKNISSKNHSLIHSKLLLSPGQTLNMKVPYFYFLPGTCHFQQSFICVLIGSSTRLKRHGNKNLFYLIPLSTCNSIS